MKKKILIGFILILIFWIGINYFFIKPYDFIFSLKVKSSRGTLFQGANEWIKRGSTFVLLKQIPLKNIIHKYNKNSDLTISWNFTTLNDSISLIKIGCKNNQLKNSFKNRLNLLLHDNVTDKEQMIFEINSYKKTLKKYLNNFKVFIVQQESMIPEVKKCACISTQSNQYEKAQEMMRINNIIVPYLNQHKIKILKNPFIQITNWNINNENIEFDFCFQIEDKIIESNHNEIFTKSIQSTQAIKAVYYGNYRTSDRAWFQLYDYAEFKKINVKNTPIEFFFHNPHDFGNELDWKADIYMPIK